jgi:transcriptional regulator with XRE-family HTH domain
MSSAAERRAATNLRGLGDAIRAVRKERGISQENFGRAAGLDRSYFGAIERGEFNITIATLLCIATALDVSASELLARAFGDKPSAVVKRQHREAKDGDA